MLWGRGGWGGWVGGIGGSVGPPHLFRAYTQPTLAAAVATNVSALGGSESEPVWANGQARNPGTVPPLQELDLT